MSLLDNTSDLIMPDIDWLRDNGFDTVAENSSYISRKWFDMDIDLSRYGAGKICCRFFAYYDWLLETLIVTNEGSAGGALMSRDIYFNSHSLLISDREQIAMALKPEYLSQHFKQVTYEYIG